MHKLLTFITALILIISASGCSDKGSDSAEESSAMEGDEQYSDEKNKGESEEDYAVRKFSKSIGVLSGSELNGTVSKIDQDEFNKGFKEGFSLQQPAYDTELLSKELNKLEEYTNKLRESGDESQDAYDAEESLTHLSYALGYIRGSQVSQFAPELKKEQFLASFAEAYKTTPENIDQDREEVRQYIEASQKREAAERDKKSESNLEISTNFLKENKEKEGVVTTDSGLQYVVLQDATGDKPKATDTVEVHYEGKLIDETVFDSSYQRNQTATFPLNGVISGWTEGLQYMPVGSKFRFFIPPELGYGIQGSGNKIGPNALLIFDVELISIK